MGECRGEAAGAFKITKKKDQNLESARPGLDGAPWPRGLGKITSSLWASVYPMVIVKSGPFFPG